MKINHLTLSNWKCFEEELSLDFEVVEIFSFPNGSGKTAVLEAINYGLYGKCDRSQESYQNHEGQTKIILEFEIDGINYTIHREFPKKKAILYQDGVHFIEGINEIFAYIDNIAPYALIKRLWFKGDIAENEVLTFKFFKDEILSEELKDPNYIYKYLTTEIRQLNKEIKNIVIDETLRDKRVVENEIKEIESVLKERISVPDFKYQQALQAQRAVTEAQKISKPRFEAQTISEWERIDETALNQALQKEAKKYVDENLSLLTSQALRSVLEANEKRHKCVICNNEFSNERKDYIQDVLSKGFKSEEAILEIQKKLAFKKQYSEQEISEAKHFFALKQTYQICPNYQEIINNYQKKNDDLWQKKEQLQQELSSIIANEEKKKQYTALSKKMNESKNQRNFVKDYIEETTAAYTAILFNKTNACIASINPEYGCLCLKSNELALSKGETQLFVSQLSRGEKTILALALITTVRDMFTPNAPLIFDESFAALSSNNTKGVIENISKSLSQVFVVTHNSDWVDYPDYDEVTTNIRTSW